MAIERPKVTCVVCGHDTFAEIEQRSVTSGGKSDNIAVCKAPALCKIRAADKGLETW